MQEGRQRGAVGLREIIELPGLVEAVIFPAGIPGQSADIATSAASPSIPFYGGEKVGAAVDRSRAYVCLYLEQGWDPTEGSGRPHWPPRKPSEEGLPESSIIAHLRGSLREFRDTWRVTKEPIVGIVPESWLEWGLGMEVDRTPTPPRSRNSG